MRGDWVIRTCTTCLRVTCLYVFQDVDQNLRCRLSLVVSRFATPCEVHRTESRGLMRKSTTNKEQRSEIAGALRETVGTTALGKSHAASFAEVVDDLSSGDPEANPAFPYASDGLLYNFVSGTASATTNSSITVLVAEFSPPLIVTIEVPSDTQIIGPMKLNGRLAEIKVGDRVNVSESAWEFRRLSRLGERMESWKRSELDIRGIRLS
jgi:hypothetical protein